MGLYSVGGGVSYIRGFTVSSSLSFAYEVTIDNSNTGFDQYARVVNCPSV